MNIFDEVSLDVLIPNHRNMTCKKQNEKDFDCSPGLSIDILLTGASSSLRMECEMVDVLWLL
jgi:hypothetical protein